MSADDRTGIHPDLEHYYDPATDRIAMDAHLAHCTQCRGWLAEVHERLGDLRCIEFVELVTVYLDASVDSGVRAWIDDHLRLCEGCRNYLDEMRRTIVTIARARAAAEPSESVRAGLVAAFRAWRASGPGSDGIDAR